MGWFGHWTWTEGMLTAIAVLLFFIFRALESIEAALTNEVAPSVGSIESDFREFSEEQRESWKGRREARYMSKL